jgi:hypothetical protein
MPPHRGFRKSLQNSPSKRSCDKETDVNILDFAIRLDAALVMGAIVALDRQWRQ